MPPRKVVFVALATQAGLILVSWGLSRALDLPPRWGDPWRDTVVGIGAAAALALANYLVLTRAPENWLVGGVRLVYYETILPLFAGLGPVSGLMIGAAAGLGEEWLFRGILQPLTGLGVASVLFGLAHVGGVRMLAFGVWAAGMGLIMGGLAAATGGLLAPVVAHGLYDVLALEYIRRRPGRVPAWRGADLE